MESAAIYLALILIPASFYPALFFAYHRQLNQKYLQIDRLLSKGSAMASYVAAIRFAATDSDPHKTLREQFSSYYSWHAYIFPILFNVVTVSAAATVALILVRAPVGPEPIRAYAAKTPISVLAGLAGAYLWGMYDALNRYNVASLTGSSLYGIWLRMAIAAVLAPILTTPLKPEVAVVGAFCVGVFPVSTINDFLQSKAKSTLGFTPGAVPAEEPNLHKVQGLTATLIESLGEAGIESAEQLAYADPVRLLLRTNINWNTILDIIDQSLLFGYVDDKLSELRLLGIRGAIECAVLRDEMDEDDPKKREDANQLVVLVSAKLGQPEVAVRNLAAMLYDDSQVNLIWNLWGDTYEASENGGEADS
jgi:hypothetical protein